MRLKIKGVVRNYTSFEIFHAYMKILGTQTLRRIWGKCERQLYRWASDYRLEESDGQPNPLEKLRLTFERLDEINRRDMIEATLRFLVNHLGFEIHDVEKVQTDKGDVVLETLDITRVVGELSKTVQEAIADGVISEEEKVEIRNVLQKVIEEARQALDAINKEGMRG